MRKIKALALLATIAMVSAGVCACGGKKAEETTAMKEETKQAQAKADEEEADVEEVADTEEAKGDEDDPKSVLAEQLKSILSIGYAGADEDGDKIFWAVDDTVSSGLFLLVPADGSEQVSFVGDIVSEDGSDELTITDQSTGKSATLKVEQITDSEGDTGVQLTTENGAIAALFPVPVENVIDAMMAVGE